MNVKVNNFVKTTRGFMVKHTPEILTGIGVAGMITSTILAVKATPKALQLIEDAKGHGDIRCDKLPIKSVIKVAWKPYIPAVVTGIVSMSCIIGASTVSGRRNAALATAYSISERALNRYRDKVVETIGEKKEKNIREKIAQDEADKTPVSTTPVVLTSKGNTLCKDMISGRLFRTDLDKIKRTVNELNREMTYDNYVSLEEFYNRIGLEPIKNSGYLGWNLDDGLIELEYSACVIEDEPCIVIDYAKAPKYDFDMMH